jgi:hypothetical protein
MVTKLNSILKEHNLVEHDHWFLQKLEGVELKEGLLQSLIAEKQNALKTDEAPF